LRWMRLFGGIVANSCGTTENRVGESQRAPTPMIRHPKGRHDTTVRNLTMKNNMKRKLKYSDIALFMFDRIMELHPLPRWFVMFVAIVTIVAAGFCVLISPFLLFGFPISSMIGGAIGAGIGCGLFNATMLALCP
jgi:hypothetical protein